MYLTDIVKRSGRGLRAAKMRTILTSLAIAVGGFTLTLTLAAGNGVRAYTGRLVSSNFDPAELVVGRDKEIASNGAPSSEPKEYDDSVSSLVVGGNGNSLQIKQVTNSDIEELKKLPYIEQVRENYSLTVRYITGQTNKRYTVSVMAYNPAQKPEVKTGNLPRDGDIQVGTVTLPDNYLTVLGYKTAEEAVGQTISLNIQEPFNGGSSEEILRQVKLGKDISTLKPGDKNMNFKIVAVTKKAATSLNFGALPVLLSSADAKDVYNYTTKDTPNHGKYVYAYAHIKDGNDPAKIEAAQNDLKAKGYFTQGTKDIQASISQIVNILQILVGVFGLITVIASVFGIVNTQYISVLERTREIGLMKALGMRSRDIRRLFMLDAGWIGFLGGAIGALLAYILGIFLNPWITKKLDLGAGNSMLIFRPIQIVVLIVSLVIVAMLAGLLPAQKAAKLDPIEALRTE